jgi:glycosyltransferase 2 family protein
MKSSQRRWVWLGVMALILGLIALNFSRSPEWRHFSGAKFWAALLNASPRYLLAAMAATISSYIIRAYRWGAFLEPIKKTSLWILFVGQVLGFCSIYLIGRPGEFVRPAYIARRTEVPITTMVAILVLERVYDTVMLVMIFAAALIFSALEPVSGSTGTIRTHLDEAGQVMSILIVLMVVLLVYFCLHAERIRPKVVNKFAFLGVRAQHHLDHFLHSFAEGLKVIHSGKALAASIVSTLVLWLMNVSVFFFIFRSLGGDLAQVSWFGAAIGVFFAVMGLMIQFPGIGGGYQVGIILALTELFRVNVEAATGASILIWIMVAAPCLAMGAVLLVHEGLTFRKLKAIAEEEEARVNEEL